LPALLVTLPENSPSKVAASEKPFSHFISAPALTKAESASRGAVISEGVAVQQRLRADNLESSRKPSFDAGQVLHGRLNLDSRQVDGCGHCG
jgi:hypothetical protein